MAKVILIVDDSPENLQVLGELLSPHFRVRVANSGDRALSIALTEPRPDLVLLDVMMPGMDGFQVLELLRLNEQTRAVPVIFVTALDGEVDEERGLALGAVDYITKPFVPAIVLARVRAQLELKQARDLLKDQNAFLEAEIQQRMKDVLFVQDVTIRALARLAEVRDPETGNHLLRVQGYMRTLAEALRGHPRFAATLTPAYVDLLVKSAPLHDVGKVGVPDAILLKPGKLTAEEWVSMRQHPRLGFEALEGAERDAERPLPFLELAKEIALRHHEKWDGSGYPDNLKGEEIPVSARLMALADVFDALSTRRVYRAPMSPEQVLGIILEGRGTHFDPDVVDAFVAVRPEFLAIAQRHEDTADALIAKSNRLEGRAS